VLPKKTLKQARALETRAALVAAAGRLFGKHGYEATQTPDIAAEAGVSTGAFYRYFKDKHAILIEALTEHIDRGRALVAERLRPELFLAAEPRAAIDSVLDITFELVAHDSKLNRVYVAMSLTDPAVAQLRARTEAADRDALAQLIEASIPRKTIPDAHAAALVIQLAVLEVAAERAGLHPRKGNVDDAAVREALREMLYRYVFRDESRPAKPRGRARRRPSE
jgi:AcrR family transcriptional regulator